jgi:F0F1-type ATP synthase assembly protein I
MEVEILGVMIPIIGIIGIVVMVIYLRRFENEERMAMIDKGLDPSLFAKKPRTTSGALRASLLLIGSGFGLLLGYFLDYHFNMEEVGYFSMLLILGGAGLGAAYMIEEKKIRHELEEQKRSM